MTHWAIQGDARRSPLKSKSVHMVVCSPPYWSLRDYLVKRQLGLETTPEEYVAALVLVFREVWRVLRDDGTCWVNIGDSYTSGSRSGHGLQIGNLHHRNRGANGTCDPERPPVPQGLKPKDMVGIPWMLAFALRADGWYLRSDVIWNKPNVMPESVRDRPSKSHEYIFLLTKRRKYFYDGEAIKTPTAAKTFTVNTMPIKGDGSESAGEKLNKWMADNGGRNHPMTSNKRSVWTVSTRSYKGAHFATYPIRLIEPCIKAGASERGCCPKCGKQWRRLVKKTRVATRPGNDTKVGRASAHDDSPYHGHSGTVVGNRDPLRHCTVTETIGWEPGCKHGLEPIPCTVFDPFGGAFTTALAAASLGRSSIVTELSDRYIAMGRHRLDAHLHALARPPKPPRVKKPVGIQPLPGQLTLFDLS